MPQRTENMLNTNYIIRIITGHRCLYHPYRNTSMRPNLETYWAGHSPKTTPAISSDIIRTEPSTQDHLSMAKYLIPDYTRYTLIENRKSKIHAYTHQLIYSFTPKAAGCKITF